MRTDFGAATEATENSLAHASRILPLLTSAHLPSASNHDLWYELPMNMPIVDGSEPSPYGDTPIPKIFGAVSPLDPQMFSTVSEYAQSLMRQTPSAKYSPVDVARWVEQCVENAKQWLDAAKGKIKTRSGGTFRRIEEDVLIQIGLGTFFAHKLRSAVLYEIFLASNDTSAIDAALTHYQKARVAWATMAERAKNVYRANVSYGSNPKRSGHWLDRLAGIDTDIAAMKTKMHLNNDGPIVHGAASKEVNIIAGTAPSVVRINCSHTPPESFTPGDALELRLVVSRSSAGDGIKSVRSARIRYRHVNQAERWNVLDLKGENGAFLAAIPPAYTRSDFALEYFFELSGAGGVEQLCPGFNRTLSNQPYFAVSNRTN
jgi:hypothetical protein